jgi:3-dehydroquinate synthase
MGDSRIVVGERLQNLMKYVPYERLIIITDTNVWHHYQEVFPPCEAIRIGTGENIKTLETVHDIYERLLEIEADRSSFVVGVGGGIVCDIAGFVASTYLRGLRFGFVSSTLLAQVDASVGGKNGVNFHGYKNMVGVFNQPEFVICDIKLLRTLPEKELLCGFAEIVKHAAIADVRLFAFLEKGYEKAFELDEAFIERLVYDSVTIKSSVVNSDEREEGERKKLNFGHTFGHALEKTTGMSHGEAVSVGMVVASMLSVRRGLLREDEAGRIGALLRKLRLPTEVPFDRRKVIEALKRDKKRQGDRLSFVLLQGLGNAVVDEISMEELSGLSF